jgi:hypothetical protein
LETEFLAGGKEAFLHVRGKNIRENVISKIMPKYHLPIRFLTAVGEGWKRCQNPPKYPKNTAYYF